MRSTLPVKSVLDWGKKHHLALWVNRRTDRISIYCSECDKDLSFHASRLPEILAHIEKSPEIQLVTYVEIPRNGLQD